MLRTRFAMLAFSKSLERLNKQKILFIAGTLNSWNTLQLENLIAGTLNFWALLSNQNNRIISSIYSIKDTMEQLRFITTKITKHLNQQYECATNNTSKIPYFLACQKICRTHINKLKRKNAQNGQIIHQKVYCFK